MYSSFPAVLAPVAAGAGMTDGTGITKWRARLDLNQRLSAPEADALSPELRAHIIRPLQNAPFCSTSASGSNFKPRNTQCIPTFKIFAFLELEQN